MNNKIKDFDEFKERLKNYNIPTNHYQKSFHRIVTERKKSVKPIYLKTSFIVIFLSVFLTVTVTAMQLTGFELFKSNGEKIYDVLPMEMNEADQKFSEYMKKYNPIMEKIRNEIEEGEFVYFLPVDAYEELGLTTLLILFNGTNISHLSDFPRGFEPIRPNSTLLNTYHFSEGTIYHKAPEADIESIAEDMYKEAVKNDLEYIVREGSFTPEIKSVELKYNSDMRSSVTIRVTQTKDKMYTSESLEDYIKITENEIDFLFSEEKQKVIFVVEDEGQKILVNVSINFIENDVDIKRELLAIAHSLLH